MPSMSRNKKLEILQSPDVECSWSPYDFMVVRRAYGATDAKVTSSSLASDLSFLAEAGPTTHSQPPFSWSRSVSLANSQFIFATFRSGFSNSTPDFAPVDTFNFKAELVRWNELVEEGEGLNSSSQISAKRSLLLISSSFVFFLSHYIRSE